jgi:hypothetical protein
LLTNSSPAPLGSSGPSQRQLDEAGASGRGPGHLSAGLTRRRHARLELWLAIIVVVAVLATLAVFLLVYHDVPFRGGQTPH